MKLTATICSSTDSESASCSESFTWFPKRPRVGERVVYTRAFGKAGNVPFQHHKVSIYLHSTNYSLTKHLETPTKVTNIADTRPSKKRKGVLAKVDSDEGTDPPQKKCTKKKVTNAVATKPMAKDSGKSQDSKQKARAEQDLCLLHCRDNLIPGSTGPKQWGVIVAEFNERFKEELSKDLAWNTL
ncbi:hypothetical protein DE146DRAFT_648340 [Phaeosphaeria sp. MPI-PUGE-AT-0046c]|nr:hypothetical protein DE146DRAFT_648340 [Phaeosphaeria sp. MPI-PUGE-AT-0046c]